MKTLWRAVTRIGGLFVRRRPDAEMREELASHIEMQTEDNLRAGMDPATARRLARIKFGPAAAAAEAWRDQSRVRWVDETARDLGAGLNALRRNPTFAAVTVLTLGITIGLNVAIYSVVDTVLLRPLPFEEPGRLVTMYNAYLGRGVERLANSVPDFFLRRDRVRGLDAVALYVGSGERVGAGEAVELVPGLRVTPSFFPTLGVEAALGRTFLEEEMDPGGERVVMLADGYWRERFEASADAIGRTLDIDGQPATIVGVLPADVRLPTQPNARLVRPLVLDPAQRSLAGWHSNNDFFMIGRLARGTSLEQLETEIAAMNADVAVELAGADGLRRLEEAGFRTRVVDAHEDVVRNVRLPLLLLWGAVSFVLLIGCVNLAGLMLARAEVRMPEFATRAALGAGRLRLARQVLGEAAVIGAFGGIAGAGIGAVALEGLGVAALAPGANTDGLAAGALALGLFTSADSLPAGAAIGFAASGLAYGVALALGAAALFGVIPVIHLFRHDLNHALAREGRGRTGSRRSVRLREALVAGQVALAFVLLVGAGLMLRSFHEVTRVDPGFEPDGVVTGYITLPGARYPDAGARRAFYDRLLDAVRAQPGVAAAGVTTLLPFGLTDRTTSIAPVGYERPPGEPLVLPNWAIVSPDYFDALEIDVRAGRAFDERDGPGQPPAVVIDEWLATHFWPDGSALGRQMAMGDQILTVMGVVETIQQTDLAAGATRVGAFYLPSGQFPAADVAIVARPADPGVDLTASVRAALRGVDAGVPLFDVRTLDARVSGSLGSRRTPMILLLGFAVVALLLAAVGTYGMLAYAVAQRTRETAIRIALGSRPVDILVMVLGRGLLLGVVGLAAGAVGVSLLTRLVRSLLFGVAPMDPLVLAVSGAVLTLSIVLASTLPARRATRVDPMAALDRQ